jgi:hypothetical protein
MVLLFDPDKLANKLQVKYWVLSCHKVVIVINI